MGKASLLGRIVHFVFYQLTQAGKFFAAGRSTPASPTSWQKMKLAIRGINGNLGEVAGDMFFKDQHPDLAKRFMGR